MTEHTPAIAISDAEHRLHRTPRALRRLRRNRYPRDLFTGRPITEFVALADEGRRLGLAVVPRARLEEYLARGAPILKFGQANLARDLELVSRFPNVPGEWNARNLETVGDFNHYLRLGRETWNLFLTEPTHQARLRDLFRRHGRLFVKTVTKGHAQLYGSYDEFAASVGNVSLLDETSLDLLVSEPLAIRRIDAETPEGRRPMPDEWRHHVYRKRRIASTHAFACEPRCTDASGEAVNVERARAAIEELGATEFATSYVLDTGTLADGSAAVIETNSFFASGLYSRGAVRAVAEALAGRTEVS